MVHLKAVKLTGLKAAGDPGVELGEGEFLAYASTWTREPDYYGDVVKQGAFGETIKAWEAGGDTLPILFGHDTVDPFSNIGGALSLKEDDRGLLVHGKLDLENPKAAQVYRMLKGRRIGQLSFAYDVLEDGVVELEGKSAGGGPLTARELRKLALHEVSIVPVGANQDTEVLAVKAAAENLLSTKNFDAVKAAHEALGRLLKASEPDPDEASKAAGGEAEAQERAAHTHRAKSALTQVAFIASL